MKRPVLILVSLFVGFAGGLLVANRFLHGEFQPPPLPPREQGSYREVAKRVLPAVVSLEARGRAARPEDRVPGRPDVPMDFGSGFLVDAGGWVLTNYHVVEGAVAVEVFLPDGRKFLSRDLRADPKTDLVLIKIEANQPLPFLELGDSDAMEIGDHVLAFGAPFGLSGSVTQGIISAKGRSLKTSLYEDFLQTDAAINPGNSGGPLVSLDGKVIGLNSAIKSRSGGWQGVGMAIASNLAREVVPQLQRDGFVRRGYLGLQMKDVDSADLAGRLGLKEVQGVIVTQVFEKGPAAKAGVQNGDVILSLGGTRIKDGLQLQGLVGRSPLNKPAELVIVRDGETRKLEVTIEEQPRDYNTPRVPITRPPEGGRGSVRLDSVGADIGELTPELAQRLGFPEGLRGAVMTQVDRDGIAAASGLRPGTVVVKVDRQPISTAAEFKDRLAAGDLARGVLLQVQTPQGGAGYVVLRSESR
jgi:serine protease Do